MRILPKTFHRVRRLKHADQRTVDVWQDNTQQVAVKTFARGSISSTVFEREISIRTSIPTHQNLVALLRSSVSGSSGVESSTSNGSVSQGNGMHEGSLNPELYNNSDEESHSEYNAIHCLTLSRADTEEDGDFTLVEEFCNAGNLSDLIMQGKFENNNELVLTIMQQLVCGVVHMHVHNVAHCDIKPENIVVSGHVNGEGSPLCAKLCDFEHAVVVSDAPTRSKRRSSGRCSGSIPYCAPEMFSSEPTEYNHKALDVWSCGIVLYVMLTGVFPWCKAAVEDDYCRLYLSSGDTKDMDGWDQIPVRFRPLMLGMLQVDPSRRLTIQDVERYLGELSDEVT